MNVNDSLLFLRCSRWALSDLGQKDPLLEANKIVSHSVKNDLSDYQVLSLMIDGIIPKETSNIFHELYLIDTLKQQIVENYHFLSSYVNPVYLNEILENVSSLEPKGLTSKLNSKKQKYERINEIKYWNNLKRQDDPILSEFALLNISELVNGESIDTNLKKQSCLETIFEEDRYYDSDKGYFVRNYAWAKTKALTSGDPTFSRQVHDSLKRFKDGQISDREFQNNLDSLRYKYDKRYLKDAKADRFRALGPHGFYKTVKEKPTLAAASGSSAALIKNKTIPSAMNFISQNKGKLAAGALASIGLYAAYKGIKKMMEKKKEQCSNLSGPARIQCLQRANIEATKSQITTLNKLIPGCSNTENPQACKENIKSKLIALQNKLKSGG